MCMMIYGVACLFFLYCDFISNEHGIDGFIQEYGLRTVDKYGMVDQDLGKSLVTMMYFSLTVLSTVGYGDYYPVVSSEMLLCSFFMMMGVAVFSWIMGEVSKMLTQD
jgi:hypothetical protein